MRNFWLTLADVALIVALVVVLVWMFWRERRDRRRDSGPYGRPCSVPFCSRPAEGYVRENGREAYYCDRHYGKHQ